MAVGLVIFGGERGDFFAVREILERFGECGGGRVGNGDRSDRLLARGGLGAEFHRTIAGGEHAAVVDFGEVVIFGSEPENRHGGDAARGQILREARRGESFINGVSRARKKPHLLPGDDGHRAGFG